MDVVLVTGMSGAGKTTLLNILEDKNHFRVDNLPPSLLQVFCDLLESQQEVNRAAVGIDVRSGSLTELLNIITRLKEMNHKVEIIFLEADDKTLVKRYQETRRIHPLREAGQIGESIRQERERIQFLKEKADYIIDTSNLLIRQLKHQIELFISISEGESDFVIELCSFGFKHGILEEADMVFDVRFLKNPFYDETLRGLTGQDKQVFDYVMSESQGKEFVLKVADMVQFLLPQYRREGRQKLVIGIGCTGGHHRSVSIARAVQQELSKKSDCLVRIYHRDITI